MPRISSFDVTEKGLRDIEEMMQVTGTTTKKDLFNNALTILQWAIEERQKGHSIAAISETTNITWMLEMPILRNVEVRK